ncbi:uncharacterized protein LOC128395378 [Panonychus citri]|uniref:uncharacterized protein LOC128395378 n=1 Tax=Panonychus citri TaxID=50023 RepID=UPI0023082C20|nr:uncharacterized protein LOC128395378 [Panonychus citri]
MSELNIDKFVRKINNRVPTRKDYFTEIAKIPTRELTTIIRNISTVYEELEKKTISISQSAIGKMSHIITYARDNMEKLNLLEAEVDIIKSFSEDKFVRTPPVTTIEKEPINTYSRSDIVSPCESVTGDSEISELINKTSDEPGPSWRKDDEISIPSISGIQLPKTTVIDEDDLNDEQLEEEAVMDIDSDQPERQLKRKFGTIDLHRENVKVRLDNVRKVKKVFHRVEDKPIPDKWKPWSTALMEPLILINHPSIPPFKLLVEISQALKSKALEAFPARIIRGRDAVRVVCSDLQDIQLARKSLLEWRSDLIIKKPSCYDPKVKMAKIPKIIETDEEAVKLVDEIMIQNGAGGKGNWSFVHRLVNRPIRKTDIIISITPRIRDFVQERRGKFFYDFKEIIITDFFHVRMCYRCFSYEHIAKMCKNQLRCQYCTGSHDSKTCGVKNQPQSYQCDVCKQKGNPNINHTPFDWECQEYQKRLRQAIQLVNYDYQWIMRE